MERTVYLNGSYLPENKAKISIFDRGVLFGDAIYEVAGVIDGRLIDFDAHMQPARGRNATRETSETFSFGQS